MSASVTADLRVLPDAGALAAAAAGAVARVLADAVRARGSAALVLAGGSTPRALYRALASSHRRDAPWERVMLFWGDERDVPPDDERSNFRMARETLLDGLPFTPQQVHPIPAGGADADAAARAYETTLRAHFPGAWPAFDLVLLGLGEDGHTASLFPGDAALAERRRWVVPATSPLEPRRRITLTLPALTHANHVFVLVAGAAKASALAKTVREPPSPACPASLLRTGSAPVTWWADAEAAALSG